MKARDKKLLVLRQLGLEVEPADLKTLQDKLNFSDRSLRRWLNELVIDGSVKKTGHKRSTKYQVVAKTGNVNGDASNCFSSASLEAIRYVRKSLFERNPIAYNREWLDFYRPNQDRYLPSHFVEQLEKAGKKMGKDDPAGTYAKQIYTRVLIDLSYNSSRLEGNTYSLLDTEKLVISGKTAEGKLDEEKVMILNHKEAIRYLIENAPRLDVTEKTVYTLHYLLSDGLVEPQYAGKVRDHWVRITGSTYIPFDEPKRLQDQLGKIINKAASIREPFEQSLFLLVHLSYLQAFSDVNKRTARLAANIPLVVNNLVPLSFNDIERDDYMSAMLAIYELQDVRPIIDLFVYSYLRTCAAYESVVKASGFDQIRIRYRSQLRKMITEIIKQLLSGAPLEKYIETEVEKHIPEGDQDSFREDIYEDLRFLDENRIAGLRVSEDELHRWLEKSR